MKKGLFKRTIAAGLNQVRTMTTLLYLSFALGAWAVLLADALSNSRTFRPSAGELANPNVHPQRSVYGIKSIQPDGWNVDDLVGNGAGGVAMNFPW